MSHLFACDKCETVDLDVLSTLPQPCPSGKWLCTCCMSQPWHNQFPKETYDPEKHLVVNRPSGIGLG